MDENSSNLLHYGFSSIDEEIAKDQRDAENAFATSSSTLDNSASQDGLLRNVDPSVIYDINGAGKKKKQQEMLAVQSDQPAQEVAAAEPPKAKPAAKPRKRKAAKVPKDENAPKQPQSGYVLYMNERRDAIKASNPQISFSDLTKTIASEWSSMEPAEKKKYLESAMEKKAKYMEELEAYKRSDTFKKFQIKQKSGEAANTSKVVAGKETSSSSQPKSSVVPPRMPGMDIPIFTEEFLEHNKNREKELRELRKLNFQYEEQNAILGKHVDDLKGIVSSLEEEANTQRNNNIALIQHLESLRETLTTSFASVPLPGCKDPPTTATIDSYMSKLQSIILNSPEEHQDLVVAVREIVNKLNLEAYVT